MTTPTMNLEQARFNMIEQQIRPWEVLDQNVLQLLNVVKREDFVPLSHKALAFVDMEIPLQGNADEAMRLGQVMLAPKLEARILQELGVQKHESVLEIGTGSGYMAALLAHRGQRVLSFEIDPALAQMARANLQRAGISNAEVRNADGAKDLSKEGTFDVIVLSGSVASVPPALLSMLKAGGRLAAITGFEPVMRATFVNRSSEAGFATSQPFDTSAPRLLNFAEPSKFSF